jgi:hypothetical protein
MNISRIAGIALLALFGQARPPLVRERITRIGVSVGDDSCYTSPLTDSASISAVVQFINSRVVPADSGPPWNLGGVHAALYHNDSLVVVFGVGLTRRGFEFYVPPRMFRTWPAPTTELDEFLRLVRLKPGTNAGLGLPSYCPR